MAGSSDYDILIPYLQSFIFGTGPNQMTSYTIEQDNPSYRWVFKQLAVENSNGKSTATTVALYLNGVLLAPSAFMTPTPNGLGTSASGQPYIPLQATDKLKIAIQGATTGDQIEVQGLYTAIPIGG